MTIESEEEEDKAASSTYLKSFLSLITHATHDTSLCQNGICDL